MHPALRQYVERPSPRTARWIFVGALTGFAGVALAFACVHAVDTRHANDHQATIEAERTRFAHDASDLVLARTLVRDYAVIAWPKWVAANPSRACPSSIAELAPYIGPGTEVDPWGHAFHFRCNIDGTQLSASSDGPDGIRGTSDDIWSE